jgi:hypothetical protein
MRRAASLHPDLVRCEKMRGGFRLVRLKEARFSFAIQGADEISTINDLF